MACTRPLNAYKSPSGKIFFSPSRDAEFIQLPCGQCVGCRLSRSRSWATRCMHEAHMHTSSCFVTLTYAPEHLPAGGTLVRKHVTDFLKRLRFHLDKEDIKIRYFGCGEYGDKLARPHYHIIIFGYDFPDKRLYKAGKFPLYNSALLSSCWSYGHAVVAGFSFESAAYTARYCVKKINGAKAAEHYGDRVPEFQLSSNRPGIGYHFFMKYYEDIVNYDECVGRGGKKLNPPDIMTSSFLGVTLNYWSEIKQSGCLMPTLLTLGVLLIWINLILLSFNK